jgi:hypothetical protein
MIDYLSQYKKDQHKLFFYSKEQKENGNVFMKSAMPTTMLSGVGDH